MKSRCSAWAIGRLPGGRNDELSVIVRRKGLRVPRVNIVANRLVLGRILRSKSWQPDLARILLNFLLLEVLREICRALLVDVEVLREICRALLVDFTADMQVEHCFPVTF